MLGIIAVLYVIGAIIYEQYSRSKDTTEKAKQREKEKCDALGIDTFEVRMQKIKDDAKWRKEHGIS